MDSPPPGGVTEDSGRLQAGPHFCRHHTQDPHAVEMLGPCAAKVQISMCPRAVGMLGSCAVRMLGPRAVGMLGLCSVEMLVLCSTKVHISISMPETHWLVTRDPD